MDREVSQHRHFKAKNTVCCLEIYAAYFHVVAFFLFICTRHPLVEDNIELVRKPISSTKPTPESENDLF